MHSQWEIDPGVFQIHLFLEDGPLNPDTLGVEQWARVGVDEEPLKQLRSDGLRFPLQFTALRDFTGCNSFQ